MNAMFAKSEFECNQFLNAAIESARQSKKANCDGILIVEYLENNWKNCTQKWAMFARVAYVTLRQVSRTSRQQSYSVVI